MKHSLLMLTVVLLCGFTYGYKNNQQTGKPDLVTTGISTADVQSIVCAPDGSGIYDGAPGADGAQGVDGAPGPANILTIGTVTTLSYGSSAFANISGHTPNQVLSLGIVQGPPGSNATVTQQAVTDALKAAGGDPLDRQPLSPQTNATSMYQVRDLSGNVTWFQAASGTKYLTSTGTVVMEIKSSGEVNHYDASGVPTFRNISGNSISYGYDQLGNRRFRLTRNGESIQWDATGREVFHQYTGSRQGAMVL